MRIRGGILGGRLLRACLWTLFVVGSFGVETAEVQFPGEDELPPAILDFDRRESPSYRLEFSPYAGDYFGDNLNHSFMGGANLQWNLTYPLGVAADFGYSRVSVDPTSRLGQSITDRDLFWIDGGFTLTKTAAIGGKKNAAEADFYSILGGGIFRINGSNHGAGLIGGGMKLRTGVPWFAFRVEVRNYLTSVNNPSGSDFEFGMVLRFGPTFYLPPEF